MPEPTEVQADEADVRLDRWFKRHYPAIGHGQLEKLLRTGQIRVDGKRVKANARLAPGQKIRVPPNVTAPPPVTAKPGKDKTVAQWVIYEDADVLVLNKPPGLAVQGGTGQRQHLDAMLDRWRDAAGERPKLVHRLDKDTSGVLLLAKNSFAAAKLAAAFRSRDTRKVYWAVTIGAPRPIEGRIDLALKKEGTHMVGTTADDPDGQDAATLYSVLEPAGKQAALVALWPLTGRTHQLRVHLQAIGTPILGDPVYRPSVRVDGSAAPNWEAGSLYDGLHLHARRLIIPHPRGGVIDAQAPLPAALRKTFSWFNFSGDQPDPFDGVEDGRKRQREKK
ncbi:MAG: RluA family pseudouridine synthase [Alphaproteobacteria bacterium]|nr:RluA family pseudouridine synthase [Alphaproteobacteria bacterium]